MGRYPMMLKNLNFTVLKKRVLLNKQRESQTLTGHLNGDDSAVYLSKMDVVG